jgi:hypothetical protein
MATGPKENPENAPKEAPTEVTLPPKVQEKYDETREEKVEKVEKTFEDRISAGSAALDEKALVRLRELKEKQKREISEIFEEHRREFARRISAGAANREAMATQLIRLAAADADKRIAALDLVIKAKTKEPYITTKEAAEIEKAVIGVEKLAREDRNLQATGEKIMEGRPLTDADYTYIVGIINPYDVLKQRTDIKQSFEATSAGVLVGLMKPAQRYRLIEVFMDSPKKSETQQLIDAFLRTGILTRDQGEELFEEAVSKGIISRQQYESDLKKKLEQGYYQQETAKFRQIVEQEINREYRGKFSENIANRVVGRPMLGGFAALWGGILALLNIWTTLTNKYDSNKLETLLKNPYIYAGLGAVVAGTEVATSTMKKGSGWIGGGVVSEALGKLGREDEQKMAVQERAREKISDIMLNSPRPLVAYLDAGGFASVLELRKNKTAKNENPIITIDELLETEKDAAQTERLKSLKTMTATSERDANLALTTLGETSVILDLQTNVAFERLVAEIRKKQKTP